MFGLSKAEKQTAARLRSEYESLTSRMLASSVVKETEEFLVVRCIQQVLRNDEGKRAITVARGFKATAVHEINNDGSFSKKGPYWTKKNWAGAPRVWAICIMAVSKEQAGMRNPSEEIRNYGLEIVEMDTTLLPMMTFEEWKSANNKF